MKRPISAPPELVGLDRAQFTATVARLDLDGLLDLDDLLERFGVLAERDQDNDGVDEADARREIIGDELRQRGWRPHVRRPLAVAS